MPSTPLSSPAALGQTASRLTIHALTIARSCPAIVLLFSCAARSIASCISNVIGVYITMMFRMTLCAGAARPSDFPFARFMP